MAGLNCGMNTSRRSTLKRPIHGSEADLASAWEDRRIPQLGLTTTAGVELTVADPGQKNTDSGPDFIDAVIRFGDGPFERGPVELHRRPSDWRAHGHDSDGAYAGILLHVVGESMGMTQLAGRPLLELPTRARTRRSTGIGQVSGRQLERLGDARFDAEAARIEGDIAAVGPDQTLYERLLMALGYSKNQDGFRELARAMPFEFLRQHATDVGKASEGERRLGGLLFGTAGLLPSAKLTVGLITPDQYALGLEDAWRRLGDGWKLPVGTWRTFRVRPDNAPIRRVAAVVELVSAWLNQDLITRLAAAVTQNAPRRIARAVVNELTIESQGYWARRRHFGVSRAGGRPAALVGRGRALEMTTNVALPFLAALGDWRGDRLLEEAARAAYRALPAAPDNALATWALARSSGPGKPPRLSARQQQGLLHLAKKRL